MSRLAGDLSAIVEDELRAFNVERLYATDRTSTPAAIAEAARQLPMMSTRRVVVVLRAEKLLKPKRKGKAGELRRTGRRRARARRGRARSVREETGAADRPRLRRVRCRSRAASLQGAAEAVDDRRVLGTQGRQGREGRSAAGGTTGGAAGASGGG